MSLSFSFNGRIYQSAAIFRRIRVLADVILPDCAIEEIATDRLTITRHPVEQGAAITDHAYKEPASVRLEWAWSNSSLGNISGAEDYDQWMYEQLLILQATRQPFDLITGKRSYGNMLLTELTQSTDSNSEYTLMTHIVCEQVILVQAEAASLPPTSAANQSSPQKTAPTQGQGPVSPAPVTNPPANVFSPANELST